ncbi:ADP ribosylation factor 1 [Oopsacas minuta]|uniref:ADP ribosylation factor 1 n=1 Tax=Oopsacas minuta TaxID=111878 RepID=A0AAV7JJV0_9METZ|nr:ADP ribosylation factor 1 [Oopsacas minuta]
MGNNLKSLQCVPIFSTPNRKVNIVILGIDQAGKTTFLYRIKYQELFPTIPTIGFNIEKVKIGDQHMATLWDVGGQDRLRAIWPHYYKGIDGIIFLVDSSDASRLPEAKYELHNAYTSRELHQVPLLVLANKQDLPHAMTSEDIVTGLGLESLPHQNYFVQPTSLTNGEGIEEGIKEMDKMLIQRRMKTSQ